eukprot:4179891-Pyramimonas_sp.AAC.1
MGNAHFRYVQFFRPRSVQDGYRGPPPRPKTRREAPKGPGTAPDAPETAQDAPKTAPRAANNGQRD